MTPEVDRFLDLATRPLEGVPAMREEAKGELMARIAHGGVPYEMLDLSEPTGRLAATAPRKPWPRRIALLAGALGLTAATGIAVAVLGYGVAVMSQAGMMGMQVRFGGFHGMHDELPQPLAKVVRERAPGLPLGLHPQAFSTAETEDLLARQPDDLAVLQEHVSRRMRERKDTWFGLTDDERETIQRLDPDNALWPLMEAFAHAAAAGDASPGMKMTTTGEENFRQALQRFGEAARKPRYNDHSRELQRRQIDAFPRSRNITEDMVVLSFAEVVASTAWSPGRNLDDCVEDHCARLIAAKDQDGLRRFFREWRDLASRVARSSGDAYQDYYSTSEVMNRMGVTIGEACNELGMAAEKAEAEEFGKALANALPAGSLPQELRAAAGARLMASPVALPGLTVAEVLPSRRAEMAYFDRLLGTALAVGALVFAGLVALEACRRSRGVKGLARGLMPLFRAEDHAWIAGLGIALPWLWWWGIARMSPLGMRDVEFTEWTALVWMLQPLAGLIAGMVLLLHTARWRWQVRAGFLGLGMKLPWAGWAVAAMAALALPAAGALRYLTLNDEQSAYYLLGVAGMAACALLWLLWDGIMNLFTPRSGALRPNVTTRVMQPWAMAGTATVLAAVAVSTAMERRWFAKDPLFPTWTSETHPNAFEERRAAATAKELEGL